MSPLFVVLFFLLFVIYLLELQFFATTSFDLKKKKFEGGGRERFWKKNKGATKRNRGN